MSDLIVTFGDVSGYLCANGVKAKINVNVQGQGFNPDECCDCKSPSGTVGGIVSFCKGEINKIYSFTSDNPSFMTASGLFGSVSANFTGGILVDETSGATTNDCRIMFTGTLISEGLWQGVFKISCPDSRKITVYGTFSGELQISLVA